MTCTCLAATTVAPLFPPRRAHTAPARGLRDGSIPIPSHVVDADPTRRDNKDAPLPLVPPAGVVARGRPPDSLPSPPTARLRVCGGARVQEGEARCARQRECPSGAAFLAAAPPCGASPMCARSHLCCGCSTFRCFSHFPTLSLPPLPCVVQPVHPLVSPRPSRPPPLSRPDTTIASRSEAHAAMERVKQYFVSRGSQALADRIVALPESGATVEV